MKNLSTAMLDTMEAEEIAELSPDTLNELHWMISEELVAARRRDNNLHKAFELRYAAQASEALLTDNRNTGTVKLDDGQFEVTVTRPKRVKWDQPTLRTALDSVNPEVAKHVATLTFKIDERKLEALMDDDKAALLEARTVETGKATYALSERKAA